MIAHALAVIGLLLLAAVLFKLNHIANLLQDALDDDLVFETERERFYNFHEKQP